jgi:methylmalonyl-CoA mutase, C-terminal domain
LPLRGPSLSFPKGDELLKGKGMENVLVIGGGIISEEDIPYLTEKGIEKIFGPGSSIGEIAKFIRERVRL